MAHYYHYICRWNCGFFSVIKKYFRPLNTKGNLSLISVQVPYKNDLGDLNDFEGVNFTVVFIACFIYKFKKAFFPSYAVISSCSDVGALT